MGPIAEEREQPERVDPTGRFVIPDPQPHRKPIEDQMITHKNIEGLPDKAILWCPVVALLAIGLSMENRRTRKIKETQHESDVSTVTVETTRDFAAATVAEIREALDRKPASEQPASDEASDRPSLDQPVPTRGEPIEINGTPERGEPLVLDGEVAEQ